VKNELIQTLNPMAFW